MRLHYGVWDGVVYDNRGTADYKEPEGLDLKNLLQFNNGNPVMTFISHRGFLVFHPHANLLFAMNKYYSTVKDNSCGKCTPCRSGSIIISQALEKALRGDPINWENLLDIARMMRNTSFCGVGQTSPVALIEAIKAFPGDLKLVPLPDMPWGGYEVMTAPCIEACPAHVNVPRYIDYIKAGRTDYATGVVLRHYPLVGSCGRVCVRLCEKACRRNRLEGAVDIKNLKRYCADSLGYTVDKMFEGAAAEPSEFSPRIAIIGAGPSGLTCAYHLLLKGYKVEVFEAQRKAGGMALVGIPQYRLPKDILLAEANTIEQLGGKFHYGRRLGKDFTLDDLFNEGFNAVFIGVGCAKGMKLGFPEDNEQIEGYYNGLDFLLQVERGVVEGEAPSFSGDFVVVGGGNVAMDAARCAKRLGAENVYIVYRRGLEEMPARKEEVEHAMEEGIIFKTLNNPVEILGNEHKFVTGMKCVEMELGEPDASGRRRPVEKPDSEFVLDVDCVVMSIGTSPNPLIRNTTKGLDTNKHGCFIADENGQTSREGVFAGGDAVTGAATVILAMGAGKTAAKAMDEYIKSKN